MSDERKRYEAALEAMLAANRLTFAHNRMDEVLREFMAAKEALEKYEMQEQLAEELQEEAP